MLKSDAEHIVRRAIEDTGAEFTDAQVQALAQLTLKIAGRLVEEAVASWKPGSGSRPFFFSE